MQRIPSLDGLRAISVSLVVIGHLAISGNAPKFLYNYANTGVRMFFVISGYLITTILLHEHSRTSTVNLMQFYKRRAYRILPAAGVFTLIVSAVWWRELRWIHIGAALLYLSDFDLSRPWVFGHLWSLAVEEQFYFLWPSALKRFYRHKVAVLLAVIAISPIYSAICFHYKVPHGGYYTFPAVADNLAVGCLLAIFASKIPKISPWMAIGMVVAIFSIPFYPVNTPAKTLLELFVLWPIMNFSMAGVLWHVVQAPYRLLNFAPIVWLGRISYSLYLWHPPFVSSPRGVSLVGVIPAFACACLSYYLVERPFLRLRDRDTTAGTAAP